MSKRTPCWKCGAAPKHKKPRRQDFPSEVAWLNACVIWLDYVWPERVDQRRKVAAWRDLDAEAAPQRTRQRIAELLELDRDFTPAEDEEFDKLVRSMKQDRKRRRNDGVAPVNIERTNRGR